MCACMKCIAFTTYLFFLYSLKQHENLMKRGIDKLLHHCYYIRHTKTATCTHDIISNMAGRQAD